YLAIGHYTSEPQAAPFHYILIVSFVCLFQSVNIIDCFFQAKVQGKYIMYIQVGANLLSAAVKFALVFGQATVDWFVWALLFDAVFLAVGYLYYYERWGIRLLHWRFDWHMAKH